MGAGLLSTMVASPCVPPRQNSQWKALSRLLSKLVLLDAKIWQSSKLKGCMTRHASLDFVWTWYGADLRSDQVTQLGSSPFANPDPPDHGKPRKIFYPLAFMLKFEDEQKHRIDAFVKDLGFALGVKRTIL